MSWKDNFYFYFSIFSLLFIFILIYFFYEMDYQLSNIIDIKTILTVLGTVFGAYFGAKTAGKFAISSVEKQIESNNEKESERMVKTIRIIQSEVYIFSKFLKKFTESKYDDDLNFNNITKIAQGYIKERALKLQSTMNRVDWMYIPLDEFMMMIIIQELVEGIISDIDNIESNIRIVDGEKDYSNILNTIEKMEQVLVEFEEINVRLKKYE